jgi:hypothetical protein
MSGRVIIFDDEQGGDLDLNDFEPKPANPPILTER